MAIQPNKTAVVMPMAAATMPRKVMIDPNAETRVATYGERQGVVPDTKILSVPEAQARAQAQILQFGHPVYDVKFNTLVPGCKIGQVIDVYLPAFGINKLLVIKRVEAVGYPSSRSSEPDNDDNSLINERPRRISVLTRGASRALTRPFAHSQFNKENSNGRAHGTHWRTKAHP
jgi:hypothetical protein